MILLAIMCPSDLIANAVSAPPLALYILLGLSLAYLARLYTFCQAIHHKRDYIWLCNKSLKSAIWETVDIAIVHAI